MSSPNNAVTGMLPNAVINGQVSDGASWIRSPIEGPQTLEIDLQGTYTLSYFDINHAALATSVNLDNGSVANNPAYRIEISLDGETWDNVVTVTDNDLIRTTHKIKNPTNASYVRFIVDPPFAPTISLTQFRAMGIPVSMGK